MTKRLDDWIDEDEYPDDRDVDEFSDDSPMDYDPRTIGYVGDRPSSWTRGRILLLIVVLVIVLALLLPAILTLVSAGSPTP